MTSSPDMFLSDNCEDQALARGRNGPGWLRSKGVASGRVTSVRSLDCLVTTRRSPGTVVGGIKRNGR
jgi:hypothetical protein